MEHLATVRRVAITIVFLLLLGGGGDAYAQTLSPTEQERLAPRLRAVATGSVSSHALGSMLQPLPSSSQGGERYGVFVHTSDLEALQNAEVPVHPLGSGLASARVAPSTLRTLAATAGVSYVEPARMYKPLNDVVRGVTGAHPLQEGTLGRRYTGEGVLTCVIDTGIDWTHPDFRGASNTAQSRIHTIWDQTRRPSSPEASPGSFDYGVEYTRRDIESALGGRSANSVQTMDTNGHGTHVAATVAGNGAASPQRSHRGLAPKADIVAVKTDFSGVGIADGVRYCETVAETANQPVVVNLSLGRLGGPQDGSSPVAQTIDAFTGPGRSAVVAAGNGGNSKRHASHSLSGGGSDSLTIRVPEYSAREGPWNDVAFHVDMWFPDDTRIPTTVITPTGERLSLSSDTAAVVETTDGTLVYEQAVSPQGDRHFEILVHDAASNSLPAAGRWTLVFNNASSASTTMHAWIVNTTTNSTLPNGDSRSTITAPATAHTALTVGAWTQRGRWQTESGANVARHSRDDRGLASFTGQGPLRGGAQKPDLVAPGEWTVSARARDASPPAEQTLPNGDYSLFRGTSTSSAATAGAVALLFQENASLSPDRLTTLLTENAQPFTETERSWTAQGGHGRLDVYRAMANLRGTNVATRGLWWYDDPSPNETPTAQTVGGGGPEALSVRFTPTQSGTMDGLFIRTASGNANRLRDSLSIALRADDDGTPGEQIGTPVQIAPNALSNHTSNFVSLAEIGAVVEANRDYHVVLSAHEEAGELDVIGERQSVDGRSAARRDGGWRSIGVDLGLRVSTSFALDLPSPRLSGPASAAILEASSTPVLEWSSVPTATSYTVHVSSSPDFPSARTDTLESSSPSQRVASLAPSTAYHWRVRAQRFEYSSDWSSTRSFLYYPSTIDVQAHRSFKSTDGSSSTSHLVALPGRDETPVAQTIDGQAGDDWQAYWHRGPEEDALVSFDGSSAFRFRPGNGFWLRTDQDWNVQGTVSSVPLGEDGTYAIDVHDGWNVISNPFDLDVPWGMVEAANGGSLSPLWRFSEHFEKSSSLTSARRGEAFYFLNDQGLEELRIPYPAHPNAPAAAAESKKMPAALTLTAYRNGTSLSQVRIGVAESAVSNLDVFDQGAPPDRFARTSLRLTAPDDAPSSSQYPLATDFRASGTDGHTFTLTLRTESDTPVELRADGLDAFEGQEIALVDPARGESYDLRTSPEITLDADGETHSFQLLVGNAEYVETRKDASLPSDLQFLPNYPNPFGEQTTLEYVLPNSASVRLAVYDVLGREVRVLVDKNQEAGRHTVQWNGRDDSGRRMASGVYLARLVVDGTTKVRKMTFVR